MIGRLGGMTAAFLLVLALALGACGRKGDLRPPDGEEDAYTGLGVYPAPQSVVPPEDEPAKDDSSAAPEDGEAPDSGGEGAASP